MKKKKDKKYVIVSQKLYPSQINELSLCCIVLKQERLDDLLSFIVNNGGRVISAIPATGISRFSISESISGFDISKYCVLAMCQKEITDVFMRNLCIEFEFNKNGNGKACVIDILGYMGDKGPFVE